MLTKRQKKRVNLLAWVGLERPPLPLGQEGRRTDTDLCSEEFGNKGACACVLLMWTDKLTRHLRVSKK